MLVIIPGWQHSSEHWKKVSDALTQRGIENVAIDVPGFGSEEYDKSLKTLDDISAWCAKKIAADYGTENITLCGHSYGGRIAAKLMANNFVSKQLFLIGSPNIYRPDTATKLRKLTAMLLQPFKVIIPEKIKRRLRSDDFSEVRGTPLQALFENVIKDDQSELLKTITAPTHLIWGEKDTAAPLRLAEEIHGYIKNSTLDVITNAGHNLHLEKPELLAAKIASHVETAKIN